MDKNLATINKDDFTITETGEAFISQRKLSSILGMNKNAINDWIRRKADLRQLNLNENKQLSAKALEMAGGYFAFDVDNPTEQAKEFYRTIAKAGAKAFIYHEAGYELSATKIPTPLEAAEQQLQKAADLVRVIKENVQLGEQVNTLEVDHDKSGEYVSVKRMRELFPEKDISNKGLIGASKELDLPPTSYDGIYDAHCPALYHKDVWYMVYGITI